MSRWLVPSFVPGEGYYAVCSVCNVLGFYTQRGGAQVAIDGHVCKPAKVERTLCDCPWDEVSRGGCRRHR